MKKHYIAVFILNITILLILISCQSRPEPKFISTDIDNNESILIKLLIEPKDFSEQDYDIDFSNLFQSNIVESELSEKASAWIVTLRLPEKEFFLVSHGLFLLRKPEVNVNNFLVFRYKEVGEVYKININTGYTEDIMCTKFKINTSKECLFLKKYNNIISILSITVEGHISDEKMLEWTIPLLEIIDNKIQEYMNKK